MKTGHHPKSGQVMISNGLKSRDVIHRLSSIHGSPSIFFSLAHPHLAPHRQVSTRQVRLSSHWDSNQDPGRVFRSGYPVIGNRLVSLAHLISWFDTSQRHREPPQLDSILPVIMDPVLDIPLEIFGQNDVLSIMTPFVYIFPCDEPNPDISKFTDTIQRGLVRLTKAFPWIAGKIINTGRTEISSGVFSIISHAVIPKFVVKDWRNDNHAPTMAQLAESEVPCSMLQEEFFAPITVLPSGDEDRSPLLQLQLSIITGGIVLSVMANHQAMDGTAQDQICFLA